MNALMKIKRRLKTTLTNLEIIVAKLDKEKATEVERTLNLDKLEKLDKDFQDFAIKLSNTCNDTDYAVHEVDLTDIDSRIYDLKVVLLSLSGGKTPSELHVGHASQQKQTEIKLPKLDMPTFSGSTQGWLSFRDLFSAIVHNNGALSGAEKLQCKLPRSLEHIERAISKYIDRMLAQSTLQQESATGLRKLADTTTECRRSLELLELPIKQWDAIIVNIITKKLYPDSRRQWELSLTTDAIPTFEQLSSFIDQRARALITIEAGKPKSKTSNPPSNKTQIAVHHGSIPTISACENCKKDHTIYKCQEFLKETVAERHAIVKKLQLCFNCLRPRHTARDCKSGACRKCNRKHHTLLHYEDDQKLAQASVQAEEENNFNAHIVNDHKVKAFVTKEHQHSQVLLTTALIKIKNQDGQTIICRALLDSASQASFITESCTQQLKLPKTKTNIPVSGLNTSGITTVKSETFVTFSSVYNEKSTYTVHALVVPKITCKLPSAPISQDWPHLHLLKLADPKYFEPSQVDVLLGADIFAMLLLSGRHPGPSGAPIALEFWKLEEASKPINLLSDEERRCEEHFSATHKRDRTGRYMVQLPLRNEIELGSSREISIARFKNTEKKLRYYPEQQVRYNNFLKEYLLLNHMEVVPEAEVHQKKQHYYMPHHGVTKEESTTTKLRVVFDASCKSDNGLSLNDCLMVGPILQDDLVSILLRFRTHKIAVCADIAKMYRQVLVQSQHTDLQRILWREADDQPIKDYKLLTVTYGTASAPYLAVKALQQLAKDEEDALPLASKSTLHDFYVDDYMSGAEDEDAAIHLVEQMNELMKRGGFTLRKWNSNSATVLEKIPEEQKDESDKHRVTADIAIKTLGICWHPSSDLFSYNTLAMQEVNTLTKRQLLSDIAKSFDPLGWISPVTIKAKILMQTLWSLNLEWDENVPEDLHNIWKAYRNDLVNIEYIHINRYISTSSTTNQQILAFCDASERAYAAVVYLKSIKSDGTSRTSLVAAKTRVAPLKKISIPRLELCAALLLSNLIKTVQIALKINIHEIHAYSDSTIVLTWLSAHPARWKTFVANRVTQIHENLPDAQWHHVSGNENPADCASRGTTALELISNNTMA